jgi:signal peptidase I
LGGLRFGERLTQLWRRYGSILMAVCLFLLTRAFVVQAFEIPSGSMMNTLLIGDYILVNKLLYGPGVPFTDWHLPGLKDPDRGDVIVFRYPGDETRDFIKRVVAVGGDTVQVEEDRVYVNGRPVDEPYVRRGWPSGVLQGCPYVYGCRPTVVPRGSYFVLGDNRDNSQDSRYWGFVTRGEVVGKAFVVYWSWDGTRHLPRWWRIAHGIS